MPLTRCEFFMQNQNGDESRDGNSIVPKKRQMGESSVEVSRLRRSFTNNRTLQLLKFHSLPVSQARPPTLPTNPLSTVTPPDMVAASPCGPKPNAWLGGRPATTLFPPRAASLRPEASPPTRVDQSGQQSAPLPSAPLPTVALPQTHTEDGMVPVAPPGFFGPLGRAGPPVARLASSPPLGTRPSA